MARVVGRRLGHLQLSAPRSRVARPRCLAVEPWTVAGRSNTRAPLAGVRSRAPLRRLGMEGPAGPKARHEIRREVRRFEGRLGGRIDQVTDPDSAETLVAALRSQVADRWGPRDAYFRADPDVRGLLDRRPAKHPRGPRGLGLRGARPSRYSSLSPDDGAPAGRRRCDDRRDDGTGDRQLSIGKCLFDRAIDDAVAGDAGRSASSPRMDTRRRSGAPQVDRSRAASWRAAARVWRSQRPSSQDASSSPASAV